MSHTLTVTTTTTTTENPRLISNNVEYIKSRPGLLKFLELILGIITVGIVSYYVNKYLRFVQVPEVFFLLMSVTFLVITFLILLSCILSRTTASIIAKTIFEVIYHGFGFVLLLVASLTFIIEINRKKQFYNGVDYEPYMAAAVIGLVNAILYLLSTITALKTYRGK